MPNPPRLPLAMLQKFAPPSVVYIMLNNIRLKPNRHFHLKESIIVSLVICI
jgi:hypothetical protein